MSLKSQKGYSLIEIGIGIIVITSFLVCSVVILNGCYNAYSLVKKRNYATKYAVSNIESMLKEDVNVLTNNEDVVLEVNSLKNTPEGIASLAEGNYAVRDDIVIGGLAESLAMHNMKITKKVRRIPTDGTIAYDDTVLLLTVKVEFTYKSVNIEDVESLTSDDIEVYEISALKVTKN